MCTVYMNIHIYIYIGYVYANQCVRFLFDIDLQRLHLTKTPLALPAIGFRKPSILDT